MATTEQLDWMNHGVNLLQARLDKHSRMTRRQADYLRQQVKSRRAVIKALSRKQPLPAALSPLYRHMLWMADIHIAWYGGVIDQAEFLWLAYVLREEMERELERGTIIPVTEIEGEPVTL